MMKFFFYITISLLFSFNLSAEDKVKVKSEKFDNWFLECREIKKKEVCELVQVLSIKESNIKFKFLYSMFKNQDGNIKEIFSIVTPLGVNLIVNPAIRFDGGKQYNSRYVKCEVFGCIISITNNTNNEKVNKINEEIITNLKKSNELELALQIFNSKSFAIKTSLKGFSKGQKELKNKL